MVEVIIGIVALAAVVAIEGSIGASIRNEWDHRKVLRWLTAYTRDEPGRTIGTRELARALALSEDRVREVCASSPRVRRTSGTREEWSVAVEARS
jgi:hypothetical protein